MNTELSLTEYMSKLQLAAHNHNRTLKSKEVGLYVVKSKGYHQKSQSGMTLYGGRKKLAVSTPLHVCTWKGCNNEETPEQKFKYCCKCYTKYCSKECQTNDHKHGKHKEMCSRFQADMKREMSIMCDTCKDQYASSLKNPNGQDFELCTSCFCRASKG